MPCLRIPTTHALTQRAAATVFIAPPLLSPLLNPVAMMSPQDRFLGSCFSAVQSSPDPLMPVETGSSVHLASRQA
jgi:hypothetical protein